MAAPVVANLQQFEKFNRLDLIGSRMHNQSHPTERPPRADAMGHTTHNAAFGVAVRSTPDFNKLTTTGLATVDEFPIRGRKATLELASQMNRRLPRYW
jgi:hypothetical protein